MGHPQVDEMSTMLYTAGLDMVNETRKSSRLPEDRRLFLVAWGERLQHSAQFILDLDEAGVLGSADVLACVRMEIDVAQKYREREPSPV